MQRNAVGRKAVFRHLYLLSVHFDHFYETGLNAGRIEATLAPVIRALPLPGRGGKEEIVRLLAIILCSR